MPDSPSNAEQPSISEQNEKPVTKTGILRMIEKMKNLTSKREASFPSTKEAQIGQAIANEQLRITTDPYLQGTGKGGFDDLTDASWKATRPDPSTLRKRNEPVQEAAKEGTQALAEQLITELDTLLKTITKYEPAILRQLYQQNPDTLKKVDVRGDELLEKYDELSNSSRLVRSLYPDKVREIRAQLAAVKSVVGKQEIRDELQNIDEKRQSHPVEKSALEIRIDTALSEGATIIEKYSTQNLTDIITTNEKDKGLKLEQDVKNLEEIVKKLDSTPSYKLGSNYRVIEIQQIISVYQRMEAALQRITMLRQVGTAAD